MSTGKSVVASIVAAALFGCQGDPAETHTAHAAPGATGTGTSVEARSPSTSANSVLTQVADVSQVCMVNDQFMGVTQIPIEVDGRTYYGCCEMCKARLAEDPSKRVATDPVSQREVDKATAVIGRTKAGRILYFESEQTYLAYGRPAD